MSPAAPLADPLADPFVLPLYFDLGATFLFGLSGALLAARRGYDPVGLFMVALATGVGGGLLRDGLFLQQGPPVCVQDGRYLLVLVVASLLGQFFAAGLSRIGGLLFVVDAVGLGTYAVVGAQKSLAIGLGVSAAIFIGVINAVGGGLLRDVLVREEPYLFKPGEYYALIAMVGAGLFCALALEAKLPATVAAAGAIALTFVLRLVSFRLGWKTVPARTGPHPRVEAK